MLTRSFGLISAILALGGGALAAEPLPGANFSANALGDTALKEWRFEYNPEVQGQFVTDASCPVKTPVLKITNPKTDKAATLTSANFAIPAGGSHRATVWLKAGSDAIALPGGRLEAKPFLLRSDWKDGHVEQKGAVSLRQGWLQYDFDYLIPPSEANARHNFRVDLHGSGTFYVAGPSFQLSPETAPSSAVPFRETARLSFDQGLDSPVKALKAKLVPGFLGQGVGVEGGGDLRYGVDKLLKGGSGALAVWLRTDDDPVPTFVPCRPLGLAIEGKNELGATDKIIDMQVGSPGNFLNINSSYGRLGGGFHRPRKTLFANEWRHFLFCWDKDAGAKTYLDGRLFLASTPGKGRFASLPRLKLETLRLLTERAVVDELRLFDRALTDSEAKELYAQYVPAYPELLDYAQVVGGKLPLRVKMLADRPAAFTAVVEDMAGKKLFERRLEIANAGDYEIPFHAPAPGDYHLVFVHGGKRIRTFEITAVAPETITAAMPESDSGEVKMKLVDTVDCAADYSPNRYVDDGHCAVVESPLGAYREALNEERNSGFAYNFDIKAPGKPHWLEIEYPDDKPRAFYVVVEEELNTHGTYSQSYSLNTIGVANGINNPVTGKLQTKRLLFWPDAKRIMVGAFVYKPLSGQAGPALAKIRLYENDGPLPRLAVNPPQDAPARGVGQWEEDPSFPNEIWFKRYVTTDGPSFSLWRDKLERQVQYLRFTGQSQTVIQLFPYSGDNNGALGVFPQMSCEHMPGWACLAATVYEREGIPFLLQFNDRDEGLGRLVGLEKVAENFVEAAAKGSDAIESFTADGSLAEGFNFLHPAVRDAHLRRLRFYVDQFGRYDNFQGVMYFYSSVITFRNERTGYEDLTVALFEKETGIKIPAPADGLDRFGKRYEWLKANAWDKWLDWRCAQVKTFLLELAAELNPKGGHARRLVCPFSLEVSSSFPLEGLANYPAAFDLSQDFRAMGIDLAALGREPSLLVEPVSAPNYGLLYEQGQRQDLDCLWYSDSFAKLFQGLAHPALMLSRHANMEVYGWEAPIKKYWWPLGYWGINGRMMAFSTALPDNMYLPQTLAWSLANCDPWRIEHGWWGNPENGGVDRFQKFYQAYRAIPAIKFDPAPGVNDPVMVRQSGEWFYVVNQQYYQTKVKITLDAGELTDAVHNRPVKVESGVLELTLKPYQVCCFRAAKPLGALTVEQGVPAEIVAELSATVEKLKKGARLEPSPLAKAAEELLTAKRYSALYYLTRSFSARKLLEAADKALDVKANLNPDTNNLDVTLWNRDSAPVTGSLDGKTFSLQPGGRGVLSFPKALSYNLPLVANGVSKSLSYKFRPIVAATAKDIKVDGDLSDWRGTKWSKLAPCDFTIDFKPPLRQGHDAFPAEYAIAWDAKGLYLALKVVEKDYLPAAAGAAVWQHDSLEIMVDQANDAQEGVKETDKNDLTFFLDGENAPAPGGLAAVKREGGTTLYEAFIPTSALPEAELKPGANIGFALKLHNREHVTPALDSWGIMVSCPEYPCGRPDRWNDLLLSAISPQP